MNSFDILAENPAGFLAVAGLVGLMVGSFLNVVIHRLPIMLEHSWKQECRNYLELEPEAAPEAPYNLLTPRSHCPQCAKPVAIGENIPILSYLLLRGRCSGCGTRISPRYPAVELLTALVSVAVAYRFGFGPQTAAALPLSWCLIALTFIDIDRQLLPDSLTLPMLWLGLFLSLFGIFTDSAASILGAIFGYLSLWTVYQLFKLATGKEGMGYGDFKLLALIGAWLGWDKLPMVILLSSLVGAVIGIAMILLSRQERGTPIPFGPYLAIAGWIALVWGDAINAAYLGQFH
ncbi:prepilin peptidase [Methylomagnum ishizawai]|uniref:prepilin peptidase n=1 Tax=Methylomagnum ishizawai TaxID=1760988 RepID=UPI001C32604D|nr:A24 family peptidase [Methylomagnum ishizawai]BBL74738.1 type 4 prepilin-like proteins leader peptide-processing enzyme [Methylomagnum ishizawai]